ncbi:MAG: DsbA family oxidoreductase [Clostridiales bacterium]|nr:DsbA family oxidoreductase [Clostridiales bacterium]
MRIQYWSDYACPYCYIGETNLRHALDELGVSYVFEMKAFELNPYAKKSARGDIVAMFAAKYQLNLEDAQKRVDSINEMARAAGLEFDYAKVFHTNTFDAHRLTKMAMAKGGSAMADQMAERLYKAYFAEGVDVGDQEVLVKLGNEVGLDPADIRAMLEGKDYSEQVSLDERQAQMNRISSVPCFIIEDTVAVPGAMPKEQFMEVIKKYFPETNQVAI